MNRILAIITILFVSACNVKTDIKSDVQTDIDFFKIDRYPMSNIIESVKYLPLNLENNVLLSEVSKMSFTDNHLLLGDYKNDKIVVFDKNGNFQYELDKKGRSAQEYLELKSYCADNKHIYTIDNYKRKLNVYNINDGSYVKSISMPVVAWDIERVGNDKFVIAYSALTKNDKQNDFRLYILDNNLDILKKEFPYDKHSKDPIGKNSYFTRTNDGDVVFHWCGSNQYQIIKENKGDIEITVNNVNFRDKSITNEVYENFNEINNRKLSYIYETPLINNDYTLLDIIDSEYEGSAIFYSKDNQLMINKEGDNIFMPYPSAIMNDCFVYVLDSFEGYSWLKEIGFPKASNNVEEKIKNGDLVIISYKLKHLN